MIFENKLISGTFIKRYKRFFIDAKLNNKIVTAHCPNTGSMMGLLKKGSKVWLSKSNDPKRKLKYTTQVIINQNIKVGINTHLTNKLFEEALVNNSIKYFKEKKTIIREKKFGSNTRFDFLVNEKNRKTFIEVKNVTLCRKNGIAEFPDAVTSRGAKHLEELIFASQKGYKIFLAFVIQREDCNKLLIAKDIDKNYYNLLTKALNFNLKVICFDCKISPKGIKLNREIKFQINE